MHTYSFINLGAPGKTAVHAHGHSVAAVDSCFINTSNFSDLDHDYDAAVGGGLFYASSNCGPAAGNSAAPQTAGYSWSPHHAFAPGSAYTATQGGPGTMAYTAGTDGGIDPILAPCAGNGIVSDNPATDPRDCGRGALGLSPGSSSVIRRNTPAATCEPADGYVAVFFHWGPLYFTCDGPDGACAVVYPPPTPPSVHVVVGPGIMSIPTWGTIVG